MTTVEIESVNLGIRRFKFNLELNAFLDEIVFIFDQHLFHHCPGKINVLGFYEVLSGLRKISLDGNLECHLVDLSSIEVDLLLNISKILKIIGFEKSSQKSVIFEFICPSQDL